MAPDPAPGHARSAAPAEPGPMQLTISEIKRFLAALTTSFLPRATSFAGTLGPAATSRGLAQPLLVAGWACGVMRSVDEVLSWPREGGSGSRDGVAGRGPVWAGQGPRGLSSRVVTYQLPARPIP